MAKGLRTFQLKTASWSRRLKQVGVNRPNCQARYVAGCPERLLIAPQDLRTADPTLAEDIYSGLFVFAGQIENCGTKSPFLHGAPSHEWAQELHGFRWLRHLRASDANLSRSNAQSLVDDWINLSRKLDPVAWTPIVVANRVMAWLNNSPLILQDADHDFYRRYLRALYLQVRYLRGLIQSQPPGLDRLLMLCAELSGWLCLSGKDRQAKSTAKKLVSELEEQILPDGGHISRNALAIVSILLELLPLRQAFLSRDMVPPDGLNLAIERLMPMLRFFRHPNGSFAHFNGAGATPADQIATILAYDETRGTPVADASFSGYQRMEAGPAVLIMDTGAPPPLAHSTQAHAGALSFELSIGQAPLIINCGAPAQRHANWRELARSTAAHSSLIVQDTSTCSFADENYGLNGRPILTAPDQIAYQRTLEHGQETVFATQNGYETNFGILHHRQIWMAIDGRRLDGRDELQSIGKGIQKGRDQFAIRFHLHPTVQLELSEQHDIAYLGLANGEIWQFVAKEIEIALEDSVFLSDIHGIRPAKQLVLHGHASHVPSVNWYFERVAFAPDQI